MTVTDARREADLAGAGRSQTPTARRVAPPRWRDRRLVVGVVLVLVAVLLGARLLATDGHTSPVLVAAHPLVAGHTVAPGDLAVAQVRLGGAVQAYWPAADLAGLRGHPILTAVASGDLLPRSAVGSSAAPAPTREVSFPVDPARLPPLAAGDRVDVFATTKTAGSRAGSTVAVLRGVEYVGGGDSGSAGTVTVRLQVPVAETGLLVRASETASLDVVLQQPAGDDAGDVGAAPVPDPVARTGS